MSLFGEEFQKEMDEFFDYMDSIIYTEEPEEPSLVKLESVGCVIDENGVTYPMLENGGYDEDGACHVNDIENDEFFDAVSTVDWDVIDEYLDWTDTEANYLEMKAELAYGI